ncbi:myosin light chain kinase A-like [Schistocerca gregaria]|uniref:myosin light chain kinase A-like n=1 Tax=Schistocerca gregaria TaxID=7010 RepID=UPI00211DF345|nr:myosin light chain kinase A-like [Schistocerca gregaria]
MGSSHSHSHRAHGKKSREKLSDKAANRRSNPECISQRKMDGKALRSTQSDNVLIKYLDTDEIKHPVSDPIEKYYVLTEKVLGTGNYSVVKVGIHRDTDEPSAIKIIDKALVKKKPQMISNEIKILLRIHHPSIISLKDIFDTPQTIMLCTELASGGELFDRIVEREYFTEKQARYIMEQLLSAMCYIHEMGIVHRDLKPENLLLLNDKEDVIKIADFGLSKIYKEDVMSTACGTPGYVAPEILQCESYDEKIDVWSAGVIMYILLCGYPPFYDENDAKLFDIIMSGSYEFQSPYWDHVSEEAKDLIRQILVVNPKDRISAKEALNHPWFKMAPRDLQSRASDVNFRNRLKEHNSVRKATVDRLAPAFSENPPAAFEAS